MELLIPDMSQNLYLQALRSRISGMKVKRSGHILGKAFTSSFLHADGQPMVISLTRRRADHDGMKKDVKEEREDVPPEVHF